MFQRFLISEDVVYFFALYYKPDWVKFIMEIKATIGKAEDVYKFINNITSKDRVGLITHTDLDGLSSAKIINELIKPEFFITANYSELNDSLILKLNDKEINKLILTDIGIDNPEFIKKIEKFAKILIIDHHQFEKDMNSNATIFYNTSSYCAAYICYLLFQDLKNIKKWDWLAALASVADFRYINNQDWIKKLYKKYNDKFNVENPRKGKLYKLIENTDMALIYFQDNQKEVYKKITPNINSLKKLKKYSKIIKKEINKHIKNFKNKKEIINQGYLYIVNSKFALTSTLATKLSLKEKNKMFILIREIENNRFQICARRQDGKINLNKLLKSATKKLLNSDAGGHIPSAGGHFLKKDLDIFKKRIKNIDLKKFKIK